MPVQGTGIFNESSKNGGSVDNGIFNDSSINTGTVDTGVFQGESKNQGTANTAYVGPNATNEGTINNTLSNNNVNKITYPTGEYVWINTPPGHGVVLWSEGKYIRAYSADNNYTLPSGSFIPIPELGNVYWGLGSGYPAGTTNQPPWPAACTYVSDGSGGYFVEWPSAPTGLWGLLRYQEKYEADPSYTLPPAAFIQIPELEHAY
jgi:hypothetical protein